MMIRSPRIRIGLGSLLLALLAPLWSAAQTTRITGVVSDAATGETLPFVNVGFVDSRISTNTDLDGQYVLDTYYATDSLRISSVGFLTRTLAIRKDRAQVLDIALVSPLAPRSGDGGGPAKDAPRPDESGVAPRPH